MSSEVWLYDFPPDLRNNLNVLDFGITPSGSVWVLADSSDHGETVAFAFNSKGEVKSRTNFTLPPGVNIYSFLASDREAPLLSGNHGDMAAKELQGPPYGALFDRPGNLLRRLRNVSDKIDLKQMGKFRWRKAPPSAKMVLSIFWIPSKLRLLALAVI